MRKPDLSAMSAALHAMAPRAARPAGDRLTELVDFGSNPGALTARLHVPATLPDRPALVVVLHGCTQSADGYDAGSGWSELADRDGFVLLYPEQRRANNANLCFNWFVPEDVRRDGGEALSIRQMIDTVVARHGVDPARVFVTGLSAGGAMAAVLLATYPECFAGGAIVAGLPYGVAANMPEALGAMRTRTRRTPAALGALVRAASGHDGPWPAISVWHGDADATVDPGNADAIVDQWRAVHGLGEAPPATDRVDGCRHRVWRDAAGRVAVEDYRVPGMGHGVPLATRGADPCGVAGPFMLEAGIASTRRIAEAWGLSAAAHVAAAAPTGLPAIPTLRATRVPPAAPQAEAATGIAGVIEGALRAAGLMR